YQFSHALVQQTLAEELSPSRRVRLHARIGTALESLCGTNVEAHAAELAYHFLEAEPVLGLAKLVSYSRLAGERALATYAHEEALAHFERALAAREGQAMDSETADLLSGLGHAQGATGQVREAWNTLSRAFDFYLEAGEVAKAVAVAEHPLLFVSGLPPGDTQLAERALTLVPPDSHEAGRLLSRHGLLLNLEQGDYAGAQKAFERALVIARRENDLALEMRTLANAADADWYQIHPQEVLQKSLRAIELAQRVQDPHTEIFSRFLAMYTSTAMGDLAGASEHCLNMLTQAERARDRGFLAMACLTNLFLCRHQGDWPAAREFSDRGLAAEPKATWLIGFRAVLEYQVGDFAQGETYLERLLEAMRATPPGPNPEYIAPACLLPMVDRITGIVDRLGIAKAAAVAALASPSTTPLYAMWARFGLALVAVQQGDLETASEQYNTLKPIVRGTMLPGLIGGDRLLGLLAQTMGNLNRAVDHFEEAGAFCRKASYHPELAWNCSDYAEALFQRNGPGDRAKASTLLEEALAISLKLGMGPLRERVINLQAIVESQSDTQPLYPDGLTRREVEVLRLIARGKSNREIAEELVLSVRTVERHIANIYGKTNAHGRVSATSYALQHDLASYK
ncbi:MAG: LuxR C-terminal-related transcriptional regulator, partial [Dehalococcoidia bacterium]